MSTAKTLQTIADLIRARSYSKALKELEKIDSSCLSGAEKGRFCLLKAEAALYLGDYTVQHDIDSAIELFRPSSDTELFAKAKYLKGWFLASVGRHSEAKEALLEAYVSHLRCDDFANAARDLNRLSYVSFQLGNIDTSIETLEKCRGMYRQADDSSNEAIVAMNIPYLLLMVGRLRESVSRYVSIRSQILTLGPRNCLIYYEMSAVPYALKGAIAEARSIISRCQPYLEEYAREKAIYCENLGLIRILDGDYDGAEKALTAGLKISLEIASESALVPQIKRLFGDLYVATGKYHLAEKYANESLTVAEKINERVEIAACHRVFAQVEQQRGNNAKARGWFMKAMDLFKMISCRYELAVTRYLAATSGLYEYGERTAMLYLARQYFESEEVSHYVERINQQLRRIQLPRRTVGKSGETCPVVIAVDPKMKRLMALAENIAESEMSVLLTGATGTGKDLLARYIHYRSGREGEFVAVNAAAVPDTTVESELFGCVRGAFTGSRDRMGLIEQAEKGTLYLNEIADTSPEFQAKLLEVLETRVVRRLGENKKRPVDFRLIAATNHDLNQRLRDNVFRLDLYHRLNEIPIALPSLNQRTEDIPVLARHFLTFAGFDIAEGTEQEINQLGGLLSRRPWPGNVRQLKAEIQRLLVETRGDFVAMIELAKEGLPKTEQEQLLDALLRTGWNRREAARLLGVSEGTIRRWVKKHGIREASSKSP